MVLFAHVRRDSPKDLQCSVSWTSNACPQTHEGYQRLDNSETLACCTVTTWRTDGFDISAHLSFFPLDPDFHKRTLRGVDDRRSGYSTINGCYVTTTTAYNRRKTFMTDGRSPIVDLSTVHATVLGYDVVVLRILNSALSSDLLTFAVITYCNWCIIAWIASP